MTFNRLFTLLSKPWLISLFALFCVLCYFYVDKPLAQYFWGLHLKTAFPLLNWLTHLGLGVVYLTLFLCTAILLRCWKRHALIEARLWFLSLCLIFSGGICLILKISLGRARPSLWFDEHIWGFHGFHTNSLYWSFPSGHTTNIMAIMFGLSYLFPKRMPYWIVGGLLIAFSRVLLVQHYLSDILSAMVLAFLEIGFLLFFLRSYGKRFKFLFPLNVLNK